MNYLLTPSPIISYESCLKFNRPHSHSSGCCTHHDYSPVCPLRLV